MFVRSILFWVRLAFRMVVLAAVLGVGMWLYARGVDGAVEDCAVWVEVWKKEYEFWSGAEVGRGTGRGRVGTGGRGVDAGGVAGAWW